MFVCLFLLIPVLAQVDRDPYWPSFDTASVPGGREQIVIDASAVYQVSEETSMRRIVGGPPFSLLVSVVVEPTSREIFVLDAAQAALYQVTREGVEEIFSGPPLVRPIALAYDPERRTFLILDRAARSLFEMDRSGTVSLLSNSLPSRDPIDLIVEQGSGDYLVLDEKSGLSRLTFDGAWETVNCRLPEGGSRRLDQDPETGEVLIVGHEKKNSVQLSYAADGSVLESKGNGNLPSEEASRGSVALSHEGAGVGSLMDVDGNGTDDALTDGLLILRRLFGFSGTTLTSGAVGAGAVRDTAAEVTNYTDEVLHNIRIEPNSTSPNIIAGFKGNSIASSDSVPLSGATISGGGAQDEENRVLDSYGTIGGGFANETGDGLFLSEPFEGGAATVGGGNYNRALGTGSTIAGGSENRAEGRFATVIGGGLNEANGDFSAVGGKRAKALHNGAFVWADSADFDFSSSGQDQFLIRAGGGVGIGTEHPVAQLHVDGRIKMTYSGTVTSQGDVFPEAYFVTDGAPSCNAAHRGEIAVMRPSGAGEQDAFCFCGSFSQIYRWACLNP